MDWIYSTAFVLCGCSHAMYPVTASSYLLKQRSPLLFQDFLSSAWGTIFQDCLIMMSAHQSMELCWELNPGLCAHEARKLAMRPLGGSHISNNQNNSRKNIKKNKPINWSSHSWRCMWWRWIYLLCLCNSFRNNFQGKIFNVSKCYCTITSFLLSVNSTESTKTFDWSIPF